jgi:hypothetical protein
MSVPFLATGNLEFIALKKLWTFESRKQEKQEKQRVFYFIF